MRSQLIAAAEEIIREHGHGALSYRTVAEKLSLKRQIVHYYFESMDELLVLLVRSRHEKSLCAFREAAKDENPLRAMWRMSNDPEMAVLSLELAALAARMPAVRTAVRESAESLRALQTKILTDHLAAKHLTPAIDPEFATFIISSMSQTLAQEELIGIAAGHGKFRAIVEHALLEFAETGRSSYFE